MSDDGVLVVHMDANNEILRQATADINIAAKRLRAKQTFEKRG